MRIIFFFHKSVNFDYFLNKHFCFSPRINIYFCFGKFICAITETSECIVVDLKFDKLIPSLSNTYASYYFVNFVHFLGSFIIKLYQTFLTNSFYNV